MDNFVPFVIDECESDSEEIFYCRLCGEICDGKESFAEHSCPKMQEKLQAKGRKKIKLRSHKRKLRTETDVKLPEEPLKIQFQSNKAQKSQTEVLDKTQDNHKLEDKHLSQNNRLRKKRNARVHKRKGRIANNSLEHNLNRNGHHVDSESGKEGPTDINTCPEEDNISSNEGSRDGNEPTESETNKTITLQADDHTVESVHSQIKDTEICSESEGGEPESQVKHSNDKDVETTKGHNSIAEDATQSNLNDKSDSETNCEISLQPGDEVEGEVNGCQESSQDRISENIGTVKPSENSKKISEIQEDKFVEKEKSKTSKIYFRLNKSKLCESCGYYVPEDHVCTVQVNIPDTQSTNLKPVDRISGYYVVNNSEDCHDENKNQDKQLNINVLRSPSTEEYKCIQCGHTFFRNISPISEENVFNIAEQLYCFIHCEKCTLLLSLKDKLKRGITLFDMDDFTPLISRMNNRLGCRICLIDVTSSEKLSLLSHLLLHAKETPQQCVICLQGLSSSRAMKNHMRKHQVLMDLTKFFRKVKPEINFEKTVEQTFYVVNKQKRNEICRGIGYNLRVQNSEVTKIHQIEQNFLRTSPWQLEMSDDRTITLNASPNNIRNSTAHSLVGSSNNKATRKRKLDNIDKASCSQKRNRIDSSSLGEKIGTQNKNIAYIPPFIPMGVDDNDLISETNAQFIYQDRHSEDGDIQQRSENVGIDFNNLEIVNNNIIYTHTNKEFIGAKGHNSNEEMTFSERNNFANSSVEISNTVPSYGVQITQNSENIQDRLLLNQGQTLDDLSFNAKGDNSSHICQVGNITGQTLPSMKRNTVSNNTAFTDMSRQALTNKTPGDMLYCNGMSRQLSASNVLSTNMTVDSDMSSSSGPCNVYNKGTTNVSKQLLVPYVDLNSLSCTRRNAMSSKTNKCSQPTQSSEPNNSVTTSIEYSNEMLGTCQTSNYSGYVNDMSNQLLQVPEFNKTPCYMTTEGGISKQLDLSRQLISSETSRTPSHDYFGGDLTGQFSQGSKLNQLSNEFQFINSNVQPDFSGNLIPLSEEGIQQTPSSVTYVNIVSTQADMSGQYIELPITSQLSDHVSFADNLSMQLVNPTSTQLPSKIFADDASSEISETNIANHMSEEIVCSVPETQQPSQSSEVIENNMSLSAQSSEVCENDMSEKAMVQSSDATGIDQNLIIPDNLTEEEELAFLARFNSEEKPFDICSDDSSDDVDEIIGETEDDEATPSIDSQTSDNTEIVGNFDPSNDSENCAFVQEVEISSVSVNCKKKKSVLPKKDVNDDDKLKLELYKCDLCTLRFKKKELLQKHKDLHKNNPFVCWTCVITFSSAKLFNAHMKKKHEGN